MSAAPALDFRAHGAVFGEAIALRTIAALNAANDPSRVASCDVGRRMGAELRAAEAELRENGASDSAIRSFSDAAGSAICSTFDRFRAGLDAAPLQGRN
jgi:hypothetical protein